MRSKTKFSWINADHEWSAQPSCRCRKQVIKLRAFVLHVDCWVCFFMVTVSKQETKTKIQWNDRPLSLFWYTLHNLAIHQANVRFKRYLLKIFWWCHEYAWRNTRQRTLFFLSTVIYPSSQNLHSWQSNVIKTLKSDRATVTPPCSVRAQWCGGRDRFLSFSNRICPLSSGAWYAVYVTRSCHTICWLRLYGADHVGSEGLTDVLGWNSKLKTMVSLYYNL